MEKLLPYREIILADFEFMAPAGERPIPVCLVAWELKSGRKIRLWQDELGSSPPYDVGPDSLFVAYAANAEIGCHLALGWPAPARTLDLFAEFRCRTNGLQMPNGNGLLAALTYFGLDGISVAEKTEMRDLILRGGPWTDQERADILDYCEDDVEALAKLLPKMLDKIDLPRALLRGRYMGAVAAMERNGVPIDVESLATLRANWENIQDSLIAEIDSEFGVFDGRVFKAARFEAYITEKGIDWPRLTSGRLGLDGKTFKAMAIAHPEISPLRELRKSLSQMRNSKLAIGADGRNRCSLMTFRSVTGRNQPSNSEFIFGLAKWLRGLVRPAPGMAIAYCDWTCQEIGIAAALSGDEALKEAYRSGDPYLAFGKKAGLIPQDATKKSHPNERQLYKALVLGMGYGMGALKLAADTGKTVAEARLLIQAHKEAYRKFWRWSDATVDSALIMRSTEARLGWKLQVGPKVGRGTLLNYPMQANGAEMMRVAGFRAIEAGIEVCCPVHDAFLITAPIDEIEEKAEAMRTVMRAASRDVLDGFELGVDAKPVVYPDRYMDERGEDFWQRVWALIAKVEGVPTGSERGPDGIVKGSRRVPQVHIV